MFRVGQKAVCVDDGWRVYWKRRGWFERFRSFKALAHSLTKNEVYTVTGVTQIMCNTSGRVHEAIFVAEGRHLFGHGSIPFPAFQFRPLVERKTSIEIFTRMLKPQTTERRLDAVLHDHGFDPPK